MQEWDLAFFFILRLRLDLILLQKGLVSLRLEYGSDKSYGLRFLKLD